MHAVRRQLTAYVNLSSCPSEVKMSVIDALRNLSLTYTGTPHAKEPSPARVQSSALDTQADNNSRDNYYTMLAHIALRKTFPDVPMADTALPAITFNYTERRLYVSLGELVPPSFGEDFGKDLLAATFGFWMARTVVASLPDVGPGTHTALCVQQQVDIQAGFQAANYSTEETNVSGLFSAAVAFKVALDTAMEFASGDTLATPGHRARLRLLYRAVCGGLCLVPLKFADPAASAAESGPAPFGSKEAGKLCRAAVANSPLFFLLFDCEPTSRMAQAGVCSLF
ncbi:uncharacterized protein LOC144167125 [Haemaphysalis longicornis]